MLFLSSVVMNWYALYTKPRNEKKVAQQLQQLGFEAYCPVVVKMKKWSDRYKKVEEPLLPSYVFVQLPAANRELVFQVPGIVQYVYWLGKPAVILPHEIAALKQSLAHPVLAIQISAVQPNDCIPIPDGPFKGNEAIVKQVSPHRVTLLLASLNLLLTIER